MACERDSSFRRDGAAVRCHAPVNSADAGYDEKYSFRRRTSAAAAGYARFRHQCHQRHGVLYREPRNVHFKSGFHSEDCFYIARRKLRDLFHDIRRALESRGGQGGTIVGQDRCGVHDGFVVWSDVLWPDAAVLPLGANMEIIVVVSIVTVIGVGLLAIVVYLI